MCPDEDPEDGQDGEGLTTVRHCQDGPVTRQIAGVCHGSGLPPDCHCGERRELRAH